MMIELKTKRRWILSILEAVADQNDQRVVTRATVRQTSVRSHASGESRAGSRKAAARPLADTGS